MLFFILVTFSYIVVTLVIQTNLAHRWTCKVRQLWKQNWSQKLIPASGLTFYILFTYSPGIQYLLIDDLLLLRFVYDRSIWAIFAESAYGTILYRPFFQLQAWVFYQLFGVTPAGYHFGQLLVYCLSGVAVYHAIDRAIHSKFVAFSAVLLITAHMFTSSLLILWALDTAPLGGLVVGLATAMLIRPMPRLGWYVVLFFLLLLSPLTRENGLALNFGVIVYSLGLFRLSASRRFHGVTIGLCSMVAVLLYFLMRSNVTGSAIPPSFSTETAGYTGAQIAAFAPLQRLKLHVYTVLVNLISNFFLFFDDQGIFLSPVLKLTVVLTCLVVAVLALQAIADRIVRLPLERVGLKRMMSWGTAGLIVVASLTLSVWAPSLFTNNERYMFYYEFALHSLLSVGIIVALMYRRSYERSHVLLVVFALGLIVGNSVATFAYSRWRTHYLTIIGWGVLLAISLQRLDTTTWPKRIRQVMLLMAVFLIVISGLRVHSSFSNEAFMAETFNADSYLCKPDFPEALAAQIAAMRYQQDWRAIEDCRRTR